MKTLGEIVGKPEAAEKWLAAYDAKVKQKREELKTVIKPGETASAFIMYNDKQLYVYGPQRLGPTMYDALGFSMPPKVAELFGNGSKALWEVISLETMQDYAGDHIFFIANSDAEEGKKIVEEVVNGPVWNSLPAVKNGKAHIVASRWAMNDPLTLDWLLDEMSKELTR